MSMKLRKSTAVVSAMTLLSRVFGFVRDMVMALTFGAIYLLGNKARAGFILMMAGNTCWIIVGAFTESIAMMIANLVFLAMNARAWSKWSDDNSSWLLRIKT